MTYKQLTESSPAILVEFYASWCPHCQKMMPIVAEVARKLAGTAEVRQLDIDENDEASQEAGADTIPTFILYVDGREVWRQSGEMQEADLLGKVLSLVPKGADDAKN